MISESGSSHRSRSHFKDRVKTDLLHSVAAIRVRPDYTPLTMPDFAASLRVGATGMPDPVNLFKPKAGGIATGGDAGD